MLASFERERQIQLSLRRVGWERAWQALLMDAIEGKGPHVSQIGSTWVATMAMLDALRVLNEDDISSLGGAPRFLTALLGMTRDKKNVIIETPIKTNNALKTLRMMNSRTRI